MWTFARRLSGFKEDAPRTRKTTHLDSLSGEIRQTRLPFLKGSRVFVSECDLGAAKGAARNMTASRTEMPVSFPRPQAPIQLPPSTWRVWPVTQRLSSQAKKRMAGVASS